MGLISPLLGPRLHYVTAVWGAAYTKRFIDVVLPTHASAGNLGALRDRPGDVYWVYTTPESAALIEAAPVMRRVREMVEVRIGSVEPMLGAGLDKYGVISEVHRRVLEEANQHRAAGVFLSPDAVFADGAFARLRELTLRGIRRVMVAGLRADGPAWVEAARAAGAADDDGVWTIPPRTAMDAALRHPHPWTQALHWDAAQLHDTPSHLYFSAEREGEDAPALLARAFHLHPLLVWPRKLSGVFTSTVDGDLARVAEATPEEVHVVTDSDEIAAVELSDPDAMPFEAATPALGRAAAVAKWAVLHTDADHRGYFETPIRLHAGDTSEASWAAAEKQAGTAASAVLHRVGRRIEPSVEVKNAPASEETQAEEGVSCRLHFIVPVWGKPYIERFLRWGLPSFLSAGNLPAVAERTFSFDIVTDEEGIELLRDDPVYARLKSLVRVRLLTPDGEAHRHGVPDDTLGYTRMTRYYNAAIASAVEPDVAHVFLTPEGIFSEGMFPQILARFSQGYRAVVLPGFRVLEEEAIEGILAQHIGADGIGLGATPRELMGWMLRHPHPITRAHTWDQEHGGPRLHPHYYWPVGADGFVAHCFHAHPLAVWPEVPGTLVPPGQTLDHEYLQNAVPLHRVHLVTDTDEMAVIDIAKDGHLDDTFSAVAYSMDDIVDFASQWTNGYHRWLFSQAIRVHTAGIDVRWEQVESQAHGVATYILGALYRRFELPIYAASRAAQRAANEDAAQRQVRPWWVRQALRVERKQAGLRRRVAEVGWLRAFAIRTRLRRAAHRIRNRLRPPVEITEG